MTRSPKELVLAALQRADRGRRPPVGNPTSIVCRDLMDACGVSFPEAHHDPRAMADLAIAGHEIVGFDTVMPEYSVVQEVAALGCEIDWGGRNQMPVARSAPFADFSPVSVPENVLEKPAAKVVLDALTILRKEVGERAAIFGKVMGPWTMAYHLAGTQNFLLHVGMEEREKVNGMLRALVPMTIAFAKAQFEAGADAVVVADHATGDLIGPYHYEEWLLPFHQEITAAIEGPLILHVCGNCSDRLELFADAGFTGYHMEWQVDARDAVARVGDRMALVGNVANIGALFDGTPEEVHRQARYAIDAGMHIIGPECAIPLGTPLENLKAIVDAAAEGW